MTKVYCCNLMEYINGLSTERKLVGPFRCVSIKLSLKMIGWKEQEPQTELSIKHLKLSIAHFKACCTYFGIKPALLIPHTLVDPLI